jgi:hypothetical protein
MKDFRTGDDRAEIRIDDFLNTGQVRYRFVILSIYLSIYGLQSFLLDLGRFFSFLIYIQSVGHLGRGISPSQGRYLHTEQPKHRINAHRHPCLEWNSNSRSQRLSERRQFMP